MKILLISNYPLDRQLSMIRFAELMQRELLKRGHEVKTLAPRPLLFPNCTRIDGVWKWVGYVNKFVLFPLALRRAARGIDVVHICDHSNAMYVPWLRKIAHVITVHDLIAIRIARGMEQVGRAAWTGRIFQWLILRGLKQARQAICVSENTLEQLLDLAPALSNRSTFVHSALNFDYHPVDALACDAVRSAFGLGQAPFFLHVGNNHPRKNRLHLLRILAKLLVSHPALPHRLVLVGGPIGPEEVSVIGATGLGERVIALKNVDNEQLRALYSGAIALIFPSLLEGFGWPIIEAQACGCPVFVSNRRPMTDIGGEAAIHIDPVDPEAAATVIGASLPTLHQRRQASLRNAQRFTAQAMMDKYLAAYGAPQNAIPS